MPSITKITRAALAAVALFLPLTHAGPHKHCKDTTSQLSCSGTSTNTCCISSPYGLFQQVQFWDTSPATGPPDSWTIHGLWPNACNGSYSEDCDSTRAYTNITELLIEDGQEEVLKFMKKYWISDDESDEAFWEHEWKTHGTCISTLEPDCYEEYQTGEEAVDFFRTVVGLFRALPTYSWLADANITPSATQSYPLASLNAVLGQAFGKPVVLLCQDTDVVYEIYYGFNTEGPVSDGNFIPAENEGSVTNCPDLVRYLPKGNSSSTSGSEGKPSRSDVQHSAKHHEL